MSSSPITPYQISTSSPSLSTLKAKLALTTFPEEVDYYSSWPYGAPLKDVKRLTEYWQNEFDWEAQVKRINESLPQFETKVEVKGFGEMNLHFVYKKGSGVKRVPLLFVHGWPGSFLEVEKILPLLTKGNGDISFDVVAPSLPNFGFSSGSKETGFGTPQYAEAVHKVMLALGYERYVTQGGDWGTHITRVLSSLYPTACLATHFNFLSISKADLQPFIDNQSSLSQEEKDGLVRSEWFVNEGSGYNVEQGTKPSTIGFALRDSPVALLAWIYEKLHDWTDSYPWTDDEVLTWVSIYYFSVAGPESSVRIYYEALHSQEEVVKKRWEYNDKVKIGISYFPQDLCVLPDSFARGLGDVVFEKRHKDGGHFAAHERPKELVGDLFEMFGKGGGAECVANEVKI